MRRREALKAIGVGLFAATTAGLAGCVEQDELTGAVIGPAEADSMSWSFAMWQDRDGVLHWTRSDSVADVESMNDEMAAMIAQVRVRCRIAEQG